MPPESESDRRVSRAKTLFSAALIPLAWLVLGLGWLWALLVLWFFAPWPVWVRVSAALIWGAFAAWAAARLPAPTALKAIAAGIAVVWLLWFLRHPSNDRDWTPDQARMPVAHFEDDAVRIENVRHAAYRATDDYDVEWCSRRYDLNSIRSVEYVVEQFASWRGPAHTFLTFGFDGDRYVAISVEIRKEKGESFSILAGLFKHYEIMYVVADERDLIGLRVNVRENPVYLFPIKAEREHIRTLFVAMLERANQLHERPEFYNTLTNTCTTNIVRHLKQVSQRDVPFDLRVLFPGYSDELGFELGLIDFDGSPEEARRHCLLEGSTKTSPDEPDWSRTIRKEIRGPKAPAE
ncbi:DUF4105 domain-containing protein [Planctomycetota bacterium]